MNSITFSCRKCGNCCRAEGYVRVTKDELDAIALALGVEREFLVGEFTRLHPDRMGLSLTERQDGSCVFLQSDCRCAIHEEKPRHCLDFPAKWRFTGYEKVCAAQREMYET